MKYILTKNGDFIIFTEALTHQEVANKFGGKSEMQGAGFVKCFGSNTDEYETYGGSVSLGLKSNPDDVRRLQREVRGY